MSLKVYLKGAILITVVALLYTHMQMKIFDLAYKGNDKEKRIHELADVNGALTHQILSLKSTNHLGNELLDKSNDLQFMGQGRIRTVVSPLMEAQKVPQPLKPRVENPILHLLSFLGAQDAKAFDQ